MKILVLTSSYPCAPGDWRGGFVRDLSRALVRQGLEVEVAVPRPEGEAGDVPPPPAEDPFEPAVRRLPSILPGRARGFHGAGIEENLRRDPGAALAIPPFLLAYAVEASIRGLFCDAIVAHWLLPMGAVGATLSRYAGRPLGVVAHSGPPAVARVWPLRGVVRGVVATARSVACVSESVRGQVARACAPGDAGRLAVLPLGVDPRAATANPLGPERPLRLLFVGRLVAMKGVDVLIRAVARVPGVLLDVAGDGPEAGRLRALAADLDAPVRFLGEVPDAAARAAMQAADLLAVPSRPGLLGREEGLPRVVLEAWSCGLPVLATATGGMTGALARHGGGLLCVPGDAGDLARALRLCREDPSLLARLRIQARAAGAAFSWDVLGPRWADWVRALA